MLYVQVQGFRHRAAGTEQEVQGCRSKAAGTEQVLGSRNKAAVTGLLVRFPGKRRGFEARVMDSDSGRGFTLRS